MLRFVLGRFAAAGAFLVFAIWFGYLAAKKGGGWALAKLKSWWTKAKTDFAALEARVTALEAKIGGTIKQPAPAPTPTPVVQQSPPAGGSNG